ncbi:MAG: hypothetical protein Fur0023_02710 [Bacteroidia bacterium]
MKSIINKISTFKNIPVLILSDDIKFINNKAKKILSYNKKNHQEIYQSILSAIKNKSFQIKAKNQYIQIQHEIITSDKKKMYVCILNPLSDNKNSDIQQKLNLYKEIFDQLPIGILIHDNGKTQYINQYGMKVIEAKNKKQYLNFHILNFLVNPKDKDRAIKRMQSRDNFLPPEIYEIKTFNNKHKIIELYSYLFSLKNEKDIVRLIVFTDKTAEIEKQKLEVESQIKQHENQLLKKQNQVKEKLLKELQNKQDQLFNTINHSDYLFWITDDKLNIILYNNAFYQYCEKYYGIKIKAGDNTIYLQKQMNDEEPETAEIRKKSLNNLLNEKKEFSYEIKHTDKDSDKQRIYKITFKPVFEKNKHIKQYYCYGHEITEKYDFLNQIEHHTIKLKEIIEHSPIYLWSMNQNREITLFNKNHEQIIEKIYGTKPSVGQKLLRNLQLQNAEVIEKLNYYYDKAFLGSYENFNLEFNLESNKKITLDVTLFPIIIHNQIYEVSGIAVDITKEIEKQNQLQNLLKENEVLIKEIHHRIKNNLQVISSMINLQVQQEENPHTQNILKDIQNRVYSMALIHQTLYQNRNYTSINISNTILMLIQNILYSFNRTDIQITPQLEEIILDVNTSIPLALIVNEIVTNIAKYAFPLNFQGEKNVEINLNRQNYNIELSVKDNGVGIPKEKLDKNISDIGFNIIRALSEQINAQLLITSEPNKGTEIKLIIPQV